jgi:hypothetical protein
MEYLNQLIMTIELSSQCCSGRCAHEKANVLSIAKGIYDLVRKHPVKVKTVRVVYAIERCEQFIAKIFVNKHLSKSS